MKILTTILGALLLSAFAAPVSTLETTTYDNHRFFTYYLYQSLPEEGPDNLVIPKIDGDVQEVRVNWTFRVDTEFQAESLIQIPGHEISASRLITENSQNIEVKFFEGGYYYSFGSIHNDLTWQSDRLGPYDGTTDFDGESGDSEYISQTTEGTFTFYNPRVLDCFEGDGWVIFRFNNGVSGTTFVELPDPNYVQILAHANRAVVLVEASIEIDYYAN